MHKTGHITLWKIDCTYLEDNNKLYIIPLNVEDIKKLYTHMNDSNFYINFGHPVKRALIKEVENSMSDSIILIIQYLFDFYTEDTKYFSIDITGSVIDNFFNPSFYFFDLKSKTKNNSDILYNQVNAESWNVTFQNISTKITLYYGDILNRGLLSDLKLHPHIKIEFDEDIDYLQVIKVYNSINNFFRLVTYNSNYYNLNFELIAKNSQSNQKSLTFFYDYEHELTDSYGFIFESNYTYYQSVIERLLQFSFDSEKQNFDHFYNNTIKYRGSHYTAIDVMQIYSAFEFECNADKNSYELIDTSDIEYVRKDLKEKINEMKKLTNNNNEKIFLEQASENISRLGKQYGQQKKISNAYMILQNCFSNSLNGIFYYPNFKISNTVIDKSNLQKICKFIVDKRSAIVHGDFSGTFRDEDVVYFRFLEILTYSQILKRAKLKDNEIEEINGILFHCNYLFSEHKK